MLINAVQNWWQINPAITFLVTSTCQTDESSEKSRGGRKKPSSYQNHRWKPLLLIVSRAASLWHVICIHFRTIMHVHTCIHALYLHRAKFCSVLCWRVPKLEFEATMKRCLGGSSRSIPTDLEVVRKCRWNMSLCFFGSLQPCRCEKWSQLPLCQWRSIILACSFGSFLLFDCSFLCALLWCETVSSTRRVWVRNLWLGHKTENHTK